MAEKKKKAKRKADAKAAVKTKAELADAGRVLDKKLKDVERKAGEALRDVFVIPKLW